MHLHLLLLHKSFGSWNLFFSYYCKGFFFFPSDSKDQTHNVMLARKIFFCQASTWVLRLDFQVWLKLGIPKVRWKPRYIRRKSISSPWDPSETPSLQSGCFHSFTLNLYVWYLYSNFTYLTEKKRKKKEKVFYNLLIWWWDPPKIQYMTNTNTINCDCSWGSVILLPTLRAAYRSQVFHTFFALTSCLLILILRLIINIVINPPILLYKLERTKFMHEGHKFHWLELRSLRLYKNSSGWWGWQCGVVSIP